jgi:signal transduction histidine kinase
MPVERILTVRSAMKELPLGRQSTVAIDTNHAWTIGKVLAGAHQEAFSTVEADAPNYGVSPYAYWFCVKLYNAESVPLERLLLVDDYYLSTIDLFITHGGHVLDHRTNGFMTPMEAREVQNRVPLFRLHLPAHDTLTLYLRCTCELTMSVPLSLVDEQAFIVRDRQTQVWVWLYFGTIGAMVMYNAFVFFALRSATYLLYVLYVACMGVFMFFGSNGLGVEYLNIPPALHYRLICAFGLITIVWQVGFTMRFLRTPDMARRLHRVLRWLVILNTLLAIVALFVPPSFSDAVGNVVVGITALFSYSAALIGARRGNRSAVLFLVGWTVFVIGTVLFALANVGLLEANALTQYSAQIGSAIEMVVFSIALADRFNELKRENELVQAQVLESQQARIHVLRESERTLEEKVQSRTEELRQSNEQLSEANKQLQAAIKQVETSNHQLQELDTEKNELLHIVSHDLKNPITLTMSMAEMLQMYGDELGSERRAEMIAHILQANRRMMNLVQTLLNSNAIETGSIPMVLGDVDLKLVVGFVVEEYRSRAVSKNITLHYTAAERTMAFVDETIIAEVAENLISNAVKYSPHGANVWVTVQEKNSTTRLCVRDEGPGVTEEDKLRLFGKFARLSAQPTGGEDSTGLGLSIVKRLVEAMNGRVWCESDAASGVRGATFIVEVPSRG